MKTGSELSDAILKAFEPPESGFVGIVDNLLQLCHTAQLEIAWSGNACRVCFRRGTVEEVLDVPLRKSVFRAILARVAALCNQQRAESVSPYGGRGEIRLDSGPILSVQFENTAAEQRLNMAHRESNGLNGAGQPLAPGSIDAVPPL